MCIRDRASLSNSESGLQMTVHSLSRISKDFGLQISAMKTKVMAFHGAAPVRAKTVIDGAVLEHVSNFE